MPKAIVNKPYTNFTGGLVTEATGLTYPDNTAQDLLNCTLNKSGAVSRRYGFFPELNDISSLNLSNDPDSAVTVHDWPSPGGRDDLHFVVLQVGQLLYLREFTEGGNLSAIPTNIGVSVKDFSTFNWDTALSTELKQAPLDSAPGLGRIFFTGKHVEPFYLEYDEDTLAVDLIYVGRTAEEPGTASLLRIRDFTGIDDGLDLTEQDAALTEEHLYNLFNQGWNVTGTIVGYKSITGFYPSNAQQWILGKNADDNFDGLLLQKQDFGSSEAPKGRTLIDPLQGDRDNRWVVNGVVGTFPDGHLIDFTDTYDERATHGGAFTTCSFFAGRYWLAGDTNRKRPNGVYFSQVIQKLDDAGKFYQQNDPTSEHFNELYDDDGGVIYIPEAQNIIKIRPYLQGMVVWANNGVWYIRGGEAGFTAAEYAVEKIGSIQCEAPRSVVEVENALMFMCNSGIFAVTSQDGVTASISKISTPIESFFNDISALARNNAWGVYDRLGEKVMWFYHDSDATYRQSFRNAFLVYDTALGAFAPNSTELYDVGDLQSSVACAIPSPFRNKVMEYDTLTTLQRAEDNADFHLKIIATEYNAGTNQHRWRIGEFSCELFIDVISSYSLFAYPSYIETGAEFIDDLASHKKAPYVYSFFEPIEEKFLTTVEGDTFAYPIAGCTVTFKWDWHRTVSGGRWSRPQEAYRRRRPITTGSIDNGEGIVYTKLKARGKGKALSIRYEASGSASFRLLGFNVEFKA